MCTFTTHTCLLHLWSLCFVYVFCLKEKRRKQKEKKFHENQWKQSSYIVVCIRQHIAQMQKETVFNEEGKYRVQWMIKSTRQDKITSFINQKKSVYWHYILTGWLYTFYNPIQHSTNNKKKNILFTFTYPSLL